jgi:hypothetical protein
MIILSVCQRSAILPQILSSTGKPLIGVEFPLSLQVVLTAVASCVILKIFISNVYNRVRSDAQMTVCSSSDLSPLKTCLLTVCRMFW